MDAVNRGAAPGRNTFHEVVLPLHSLPYRSGLDLMTHQGQCRRLNRSNSTGYAHS